jgi:HEPN domain-containing protein
MADGDVEFFSLDELALEEEQMIAEYNQRFQPSAYRQVFYPPASGTWTIDGSFPEGFFESAKLLLRGVVEGRLNQELEGLAAIFLSRHYLELAVKYVLLHSRWLADASRNASGAIDVIPNTHDLQRLWNTLGEEVKAKPGIAPKGLDLAFVESFVKEFNAYDPKNWRSRYPAEQIPPVSPPSHESIGIDFAVLLYDLQKAFDVLSTLDGYLIETHGENKEWKHIQDSW